MKKINLVLSLLFLMGIGSAMAQKEGKPSKAEREAKKIAFFTEKLALSDAESEKFWAVSNSMQEELKANRKSFKSTKPEKGKKIDDMTDAEVRTLVEDGFKMKKKDIEIRESYFDKFVAVIGVKRTAKMYHLQHEFRKQGKGKPNHKGEGKEH